MPNVAHVSGVENKPRVVKILGCCPVFPSLYVAGFSDKEIEFRILGPC